jgi:hypothetical protein
VLAARTSDHKPLWVRFSNQATRWSRQRLFKYEAKWDLDDECSELLQSVWAVPGNGDTAMKKVQDKLQQCQHAFKSWSSAKYGKMGRTLKTKTKRLTFLQRFEDPRDWEEIKTLQRDINHLLEMEEAQWKQRAKRHWFRDGDRNTHYFHAWANHRRKINQIEKIVDAQGHEWTKPEDISHAFVTYFQALFSTADLDGIEECIEAVPHKVSPDMNTQLLRTFQPEEVDIALSQMHPLKSPGPDGYAACFYQKHWTTVGPDVRQAVLSFLNTGTMDAELNSTYIALIPKVSPSTKVTEFRPISLCNVLYKLIAKVLANRLKMILPLIISHNQSAFIPGRLITDNILVAYEALHTMASRLKGKKGYMAIKLDMSKAYDRVEWNFLEAIMKRLGFADRWISLLMTCVRTVSYSILLNGSPQGCITPTRGLRQGDPLSPYLFLLCAEGLSSLIMKAELERKITGLPIARGGMQLSHLFFADDSLLFCQATFMEWCHIHDILEQYERASGQTINRGKTSIFF